MTIDLNAADLGAAILRGDARVLAESLGSAEVLHGVAREVAGGLAGQVTDAASLRDFLLTYQRSVLAPVEWPAIAAAFHHAHHYELRELLELDLRLASEPRLQPFARASQTIGRTYLRRLRPLRDQRLIRRYLEAIERGEALGWHTLVYGVVLSVYSVPLRSGLLSYGHQTLQGFILAAGRQLGLPPDVTTPIGTELANGLPSLAGELLDGQGPRPPALVQGDARRATVHQPEPR
jgi:hypothetical protein